MDAPYNRIYSDFRLIFFKKMTNKNITIIIIGIAVVLLIGNHFFFAITGVETMDRTIPIQVEAGETFTLIYTARSVSGTWGVSIEDSVSGGCTFPDGSSSIKTVMLSADGNTKSITIQAPSVESTCTFTGDYKFGTMDIKTFSIDSVNIVICNTDADTNCDGIVSRSELGVSITKWISNQISRDELGEAIMAWVG